MLRKLFRKHPLLIILCGAFLLRLVYFLVVIFRNPEAIYIYDSYGYWQLAENIRKAFSFSQSYDLPLQPDYYRTPLYPLFIILAESIGPEGISIIVLQIILAVLICYFTYKVAVEIALPRFAAATAAFLLAIDVPSIVMNTIVITETLFTFLLILFAYFFIRFMKSHLLKDLIISGLLCGVLILCRPIAFFLPFLACAFIAFRKRNELKKRIQFVLAFALICFSVMSPWLIRNKCVFGHYFLSVIREHNVQNYQAAAVYALLNNRTLPESQSILRWKTFNAFGKDADKHPYEYARYIEKESIAILLENPALTLQHEVRQIVYFFLKPCRAYIDIQLGNWGKGYNTIPKDYPIFKYLFETNSRFTITMVIIQLIILLIIYSAIIFGIIFLFRHYPKQNLVFLLCIIGAFAIFTLPAIAESRFRVPVMPFISIVSAAGIYFLKNRIEIKLNERKDRKLRSQR